MTGATKLLATFSAAVAATIALAPVAESDPDIDTQSAADVVAQLQEQGYDVQVKGVSSADPALLTNCTVTSIRDTGVDTPDPTTTTTVNVEVACPIQH